MTAAAVPRAFIWRRIHSLMGLWLVLFLMEHLLVNSQAALWIGEDGRGFVEMVNSIHDLPYLQVIEVILLGVPILIHMVWGVKYLFTAKANSFSSDGSRPSLKEYGRNKAYTWQRITSWILLVGLIAHVAKFRFLDYPVSVRQGSDTAYFVPVEMDDGLYTLAPRLHVHLFDSKTIEEEQKKFKQREDETALLEAASSIRQERLNWIEGIQPEPYDGQKEVILHAAEQYAQRAAWLSKIAAIPLKHDQVIAETNSFGTASLLKVRETFKSPIYVGLYTIFVLAACFHALNGFWTFLITWGLILRRAAQKSMVVVSVVLMAVLIFLGLSAVWGTFWFNLRY